MKMRSLRLLSLSALWLGHAIASPIVTNIREDDDDIVLNIYGKHRIIINEIGETAACSGTATSSPNRLEAGPGASTQGPAGPNSAAGSGASSAGDPAGGSNLGNASPAGPPPAGRPSPPASQPTVLVPACDPALDRSSFDHLLLSPKQDFYYSQQGVESGSGSVAIVKVPQLVYPAVQLQVSSAIQRVTCTSNSAQIQFSNQAAYATALANWSEAGTFILVAYGNGCGSGHAAGEQDYLVVTSVAGDGSSTITAVIRVTDFEGAVGRETVVTVDIGIFNPTNGTGGFTVIPGAGNNTVNPTAGGNPGGNGGGGDNTVNPTAGSSAGGSGGDNGGSLPSGFDSFDEELDDLIGLVSVDDPDFDAQFFPRPPDPVLRHRRSADQVNEFNIEKRGFGDFLKKVGKAISNVSGTELDWRQNTDFHFCYRQHGQRRRRQNRH